MRDQRRHHQNEIRTDMTKVINKLSYNILSNRS